MMERDDIRLYVPPEAEAKNLPPRVKLQATIGIEKVIVPSVILGIMTFMAVAALSGGRHGAGLIRTENGLLIGFGIGGAFLLAALLIWILIDDYYVMDRDSRRILLHKGFRSRGSETAFLDFNQILAIGMNCLENRSRYGRIGWRYVPVLLVKNHDPIELKEMDDDNQCSKLNSYNKITRPWAAAIGCYWIECPAQQTFQAQQYFDSAVLDIPRD